MITKGDSTHLAESLLKCHWAAQFGEHSACGRMYYLYHNGEYRFSPNPGYERIYLENTQWWSPSLRTGARGGEAEEPSTKRAPIEGAAGGADGIVSPPTHEAGDLSHTAAEERKKVEGDSGLRYRFGAVPEHEAGK